MVVEGRSSSRTTGRDENSTIHVGRSVHVLLGAGGPAERVQEEEDCVGFKRGRPAPPCASREAASDSGAHASVLWGTGTRQALRNSTWASCAHGEANAAAHRIWLLAGSEEALLIRDRTPR
jgi:hypothetical protein